MKYLHETSWNTIVDIMKEIRAMLRHFNILISNIHQSGTKNHNQSVSKLRNKY